MNWLGGQRSSNVGLTIVNDLLYIKFILDLSSKPVIGFQPNCTQILYSLLNIDELIRYWMLWCQGQCHLGQTRPQTQTSLRVIPAQYQAK